MSFEVKLRSPVVKKLRSMLRGKTSDRKTRRIQILLRLNEGHNVDETAEIVDCGTATVKRIRRRFLDQGVDHAINELPRPGRAKKLRDRDERELIALACTSPPKGHARWTIRLLAKKSGYGFGVVQRTLKADGIKPWREKNVVRSRHRR